METTFMYWGLIPAWTKDPFDKNNPRPFNARSETVKEKSYLVEVGSTKMPNTGKWFFEKKFRIRKENYETFWLGGIWSKWTSTDGAEIETCCVLTTEPNDLIKPLHQRMPVIIPTGYEEQWTKQVKDSYELKGLHPLIMGWSPDGWLVEDLNKKQTDQMSFF